MRELRPYITFACVAIALCVASVTNAQTFEVVHQIEGRLQHKNGSISGMRVRLVRKDSLQPIGETFSRAEGTFVFSRITDGDYIIETFETDLYEATSTEVVLRPIPRRPTYFNVFIEIPYKAAPSSKPAGVIAADVDLNVPKAATKHYRAGEKALKDGNFVLAETELRAAIAAYPNYYQARFDLGHELRLKKRFTEAAEILQPLPQIAPRRAEARLEYGVALLELKRRDEAIEELGRAVQLEESSWAAHLYLGWALLESQPEQAEPHFRRALELAERKAARAHLALARIADAKGQKQIAIQHLEAYITLMPTATDADAARSLLQKLRG
jgi:tetratricopeptide (TPR) repeat protein